MNSVILILLALTILIFFHELGHFLTAKLCNVAVERFSIGFGPKLLQKKYKETEYCISAIPLGGYVKMLGESEKEKVSHDLEQFSYSNKTPAKRFLIVAAGPFFNFILAFLLLFISSYLSFDYVIKPVIGEVLDNSPAQIAGLQKKDIIKKINDKKINRWKDIAKTIAAAKDEKISIVIQRGDNSYNLSLDAKEAEIKNEFGEIKKKYIIGIKASDDFSKKKLSIIGAFSKSSYQLYKITQLTIVGTYKIITGKIPASSIGGPIKIAQIANQQAKEGLLNFVFFLAILSINLAVLNLLPIPILDGGHLLFIIIEAIIKKPVNDKLKEKSFQFGALLLFGIMIYVFYNDIISVFFSK